MPVITHTVFKYRGKQRRLIQQTIKRLVQMQNNNIKYTDTQAVLTLAQLDAEVIPLLATLRVGLTTRVTV